MSDLTNFLESTKVASSRKPKRWSGNVDTLPVEYLNNVLAKMQDYGERVQFSLSSGPLPSYQIINSFEKKMAFDRDHQLTRPQEGDFEGANATQVFSPDQIKALISGVRLNEGKKSKTVRVVRTTNAGTRITVTKLDEQFASQRYEYFRNNRHALPSTIADYSDEITDLMKQGKSVEAAFKEVIERHY